jgi:hypothetical protein
MVPGELAEFAWATWLAGREIDELDHVTADKVVDLGAADRPAEGALDHHQ